ncbi:Uncharacterised protein [Mycobacteroides abscessus]|nr:Uncharacterised protein [Mycobacteroides abscessus]
MIGAGRVETSGTALPPPIDPAGTPSCARPSWIDVVTLFASTAPSTDTPIAPPRLRKNATVEVPAPISSTASVFCTASTRFCMSMPMLTPRKNR